jgi:hypothetical protein
VRAEGPIGVPCRPCGLGRTGRRRLTLPNRQLPQRAVRGPKWAYTQEDRVLFREYSLAGCILSPETDR